MKFYSPLRYPGGKNKIADFIKGILFENELVGCDYLEPFAGGASVGLSLLFSELVTNIHINDIDRSIYAFWYSVLYETENFCKLIWDTPITTEEWDKQKIIQNNKNIESYINLGFSTFFLNRTNFSGIINGNKIGGKSQTGKWKIDARFKKGELIKRIEKIALYKNRIYLYNKAAQDFINEIKINTNKVFIYFDPPYFLQGHKLYSHALSHDDHRNLAAYIQLLQSDYNWIITYDNVDFIYNLYKKNKKKNLNFNYTLMGKRKETELLIFSESLFCQDFCQDKKRGF